MAPLIFSCLSLVLHQQTTSAPSLHLSASTLRPYIGQEVTLRLEIELPEKSRAVPELTIPWFRKEFGFRWAVLPEEWLRQRQQAQVGLPIRLAGEELAIRLESLPASGIHSKYNRGLTWKLVIDEPDPLGRGAIVFAPLKLKCGEVEATSQPLTLEAQKLPLRPVGVAQLFVGVGDLRLETSLSAGEVDWNGSLMFYVRATGGAAARRFGEPMPADLFPPTVLDSVRMERLHEKLEADGRTFGYELRPRSAGAFTLPAVAYSVFDPERGVFESRRTSEVHFRVRSSGVEPTRVPRMPYADGQVPRRLRAIRLDSSAVFSDRTWLGYGLAGSAIVLPPLLFLGLWLRRRRLFPESWGSNGDRGSAAARRALRQLAGRNHAAEQVAAAVTRFLHERFDVAEGEPTIGEVEAELRRAGLNVELVELTQRFLVQAAAARFGPATDAGEDLRTRAATLVRRLDKAS
jgi:hypothetical protein